MDGQWPLSEGQTDTTIERWTQLGIGITPKATSRSHSTRQLPSRIRPRWKEASSPEEVHNQPGAVQTSLSQTRREGQKRPSVTPLP